MLAITPRFKLAQPALIAALALSFITFSLDAAAETSVRDGVYSEAQSKRGEQAYTDECGRCHKEDLLGGALEPPLVGDEFFSKWGNTTVGALFEDVHEKMPSNNRKGTLEPPLIADALAYIFKQNGFPAGKTELSTDVNVLKTIRIEPPKK